MAKGDLEIYGYRFHAGDGARIRKEQALTFGKGNQSEVLLFDLRPNENPVPIPKQAPSQYLEGLTG